MQHVLRIRLLSCRKRGLGSSWLLIQKWQRSFFSRSRGEDAESLKVACGSSGLIDVDLYNIRALQNPSSPLIIYLPPTGVHQQSSHPSIPSYLSHPSAALAIINYRWNIASPSSSSATPSSPPLLSNHPSFATHAFPTPLHDTLHAYTYLLKTLLPRYSPTQLQTSPSDSSRSPFSPRRQTFYAPSSPPNIQRPILIYGSYLSAALATSLALTESFASKQHLTRIAGLLVRDGTYDWTPITTSLPPPSSLNNPTPESWNSRSLYDLREKLFSKPSSAFDAFVSPILFFRTAGVGVPKSWPVSSPPSPPSPASSPETSTPSSPLIAHNEEPFYSIQDLSFDIPPDLDRDFEAGRGRGTDGGTLELETRKANLKFPPKDSGLRIPRSLFLYTQPDGLGASSASALKKSGRSAASKQARKQAKKKGSSSNSDVDSVEKEGWEVTAQGQAEEMVRLMRRSIQLHEFKERVQWDEDLDPEAAAVERVGISGVNGKEEEERVVREWIEDVLDGP